MKASIHIAFGLEDRGGAYAPHMAATMVSILEHTARPVTFHVLTDASLVEPSRAQLRTLCGAHGAEVLFHGIVLPEAGVGNEQALARLSRGSLYRLKLAEVLPKDVTRLLYLDCDILVTLDIGAVYDSALDGKSLGAVQDAGAASRFRRFLFQRHTPLHGTAYFNSGVLLFDLARLREIHDMWSETAGALRRAEGNAFPDQAALNIVFADDWQPLPAAYNTFPDAASRVDVPAVYHFAGGPGNKPWATDKYPLSDYYWHCRAQTPWGDPAALALAKAQRTQALEDAVLTAPIGSRKAFLRNVLRRLAREAKAVWDMMK